MIMGDIFFCVLGSETLHVIQQHQRLSYCASSNSSTDVWDFLYRCFYCVPFIQKGLEQAVYEGLVSHSPLSTTVAVCFCQKTFQFGDRPLGLGKLPLQKAASPQVAPSGVALLCLPPPTLPSLSLSHPAAQQCWWGPGPREHTCPCIQNKTLQ